MNQPIPQAARQVAAEGGSALEHAAGGPYAAGRGATAAPEHAAGGARAGSGPGTRAEAAIRTLALRKVYPAANRRRRPGGAGAGGNGVMAAGGRGPEALRTSGGPGARQAVAAPGGAGVAPNGVLGGDIVALDSLDLEIGAGEFFGLLGPNGAGKTTTIGILTTRVKPTSGRATVAGAEVVKDDAGVKQRIGVVPQRPNPDRSLSVRENLLFHAAYFGIPHAVAAKRAGQLLDQLGLGDRGDAKVDQLSGGQQQRLMIARALIHEPQILFLDEPTVGLDPQARLALWDVLRGLHAEGRTIVMTTHYMEEADRLCERLAILDRGRLLALDTPTGLKAMAPGGTLVELTLDGEAAAAAASARTLPGVTRAEAQRELLRVYADRPGETLAGLIKAAEQAGRAVVNIHLAPPSLETLFISLTGRKLD